MKDLRKLRMEKRLTIAQLSQAARIESNVLRNYEYGTVKIPDHHIVRLLKVLFEDFKVYQGRHFND